MNADAILVKIEEDAKHSAERILSDAQTRAEAMKVASREKIEEMHKTMLAKVALDGAELEQRMLRMAELEDRKALLAQKRVLIQDTFAQAQAQLDHAGAEKKRAFFLSQVTRCASGEETLFVGDVHADWFDASFITDVNQSMVAAGKPGSITLAPEKAPDCQGVVLKANGAEIHCTFEAILTEIRPRLEQEVAALLFGEA